MNASKNLNDFKVEQTVVNNVPVWETSYQPVNDRGEPVGSRTFIRAASQEKLLEKVAGAHASAAVFGARWKSRATRPTQQPARPRLTNIEKAELLQKANAGDVESAEQLFNNHLVEQISAEEETCRQNIASQEFMAENQQFVPCQANAKAMGAYLQARNLEWTVANLQAAFDELSSQNKIALRPVVKAEEPEPVPTAQQSQLAVDVANAAEDGFEPILAHAAKISAEELRQKLNADKQFAADFQAALDRKNQRRQQAIDQRNAVIIKGIEKRLSGGR